MHASCNDVVIFPRNIRSCTRVPLQIVGGALTPLEGGQDRVARQKAARAKAILTGREKQ